ncbi:MAG: hypothetical protein WB988_06585 [Candidatus Nitrosopolaris sp.]
MGQFLIGCSGRNYGSGPVPTYPKTYAAPVKATNHERTVCVEGQIQATTACYAGYYDHMLPLCYSSHTGKYNLIKSIGYHPSSIPTTAAAFNRKRLECMKTIRSTKCNC